MVRMPDAAPKAHRNSAAGSRMAHALVGDGVGQVEQALGGGFVWRHRGACSCGQHGLQRGRNPQVAPRSQRCGRHRKFGDQSALHPPRCRCIACALDREGGGQPVRPQSSPQQGYASGAVKVVPQIFFARPNHLHRFALGLQGDSHRLANHVDIEPTSKPTTQIRHVQGDLFQRHPRQFGGQTARHFGRLGRGPDRDLAVFHLCRAIDGLHGGMRKVGRAVDRFERFGCTRQRRVGIALGEERESTARAGSAFQRFQNRRRIHGRAFGVLPLHIQRQGALLRMPGGLAHHGHGFGTARNAGQTDYLQHAGFLQCGFGVHLANVATQFGRMAHGGKEQIGRAHIDAKACLAAGLVNHIGARRGGANQFPVLAGFGFDASWRLARGGRGQIGIARFALAARVADLTRLGDQLGDRQLPLFRRSGEQLGFGSSRGQPDGAKTVRHRG